MKTFYTLLLAFGLCLTSHAQSNINVVNYQNANLQSQNEINSLLSTNQNRLLLQNGFSAKQLSNDNLGLKLIKVVNSNSIDNAVLTNFAGDYSKDRKSTRLNSSHVKISYAVFCLKTKRDTVNLPVDT